MPRAWKTIFSDELISEGTQYFKQGKAKKLSEEDYGFSVVVRGSRNYRVRIYENDDPFVISYMECNCDQSAAGKPCKHMAAALLLLEDTYLCSPVISPEYEDFLGIGQESEIKAPARKKGKGGSGKQSGSGADNNRNIESKAAGSGGGNAGTAGRDSGKNGTAASGSGNAASAGSAGTKAGTAASGSGNAGTTGSDGRKKSSAGKNAKKDGDSLSPASSRREALTRLTALRLQDQRERSGENGEDSSGAALEEYHYFDVDAIEKGLRLSRKQIEEARRFLSGGDIANTEISFGSMFVRPADIGRIKKNGGSDAEQRSLQAMFVQNSRSRRWRVEQIFDRKSLLQSDCSCWECSFSRKYTKNNTAGHILSTHETAAFIIAADYMREHSVGDITDQRAKKLLEACRGYAPATAGTRGEILTVQPKLVESRTGNWSVQFQVGSSRLYKIKDILQFLNDVRDHQSRQYGKNTVFQFGRELLDARGLSWMQFMERAADVLRAFTGDTDSHDSTIYYYEKNTGWVQLMDQIPLFGSILDSFFDTALEQNAKIEMTQKSIDFSSGGRSSSKKYMVEVSPEGVVSPRLTLEPVLAGNGDIFDGVRLYGEIPGMIPGAENYYCLEIHESNALLLRTHREGILKLRPLIDASSRDGRIDLYIGRSSLADFYRKALPQLREAAEIIEIRPELIQKYIPVEPEFICFLDVDQEAVLCEPFVYYGEKCHSPFDSDRWKHRTAEAEHYRDTEAETALMDFLSICMPEKDAAAKIFLTPRGDEALFEFLDTGLSRLMAMSEVRATDRFMRLKVRRRIPFHAGISLSEGLLSVELTSNDLSPDEILAAVSGYRLSQRYIRLKNGDFLRLEENEELRRLIELMDTLQVSPKELLSGRMHIPAFRSLYIDKMMESMEDVYAERDSRFKKLIKEFKTISDADFDVPAKLRDVLRKYQVVGYRWMRVLDAYGFGGILADDMGLGKTLQAIAVLLSDHDEIDPEEKPGTSLVVCPASLIYNWEEELHRFAPALQVLVVAGTQTERQELIGQYSQYDVLVTSYDLLKRDIAEYEGRSFRYEFIDEAQYIKNHRTDAAKCVKLIQAKTRFALTGTPIENRLSELWSIFDFIMPGFLYDYSTFREEFETAIVKNQDEERMERLRRMVGTFVLRRSKSEVLKDLPDKLEEVHYAGFGKKSEQQKLYDAQVVKMREDLRRKSEEELRHSRIEILAELTRIRQICCDPALLYENYRGDSVKKEMCMELVRSVVSGEHKALIFSQFTKMLDLLKVELDKEKIPYYEITGSTPKEARIERVRAFNADRTPVFLISLKAGGTGLNLTGADVVIHYDPWWNVAVQNQATDRAHRIGQTKVVTVYQLILKGSIEERIMELQRQKRALAEDILSSESVTASSLSREELLELLADQPMLPG